jgi:hypothetical protein
MSSTSLLQLGDPLAVHRQHRAVPIIERLTDPSHRRSHGRQPYLAIESL